LMIFHCIIRYLSVTVEVIIILMWFDVNRYDYKKLPVR
jgi:hypothetical protein